MPSFISLSLIWYGPTAESIIDARCVGSVVGVRQSGPQELEVEILVEN